MGIDIDRLSDEDLHRLIRQLDLALIDHPDTAEQERETYRVSIAKLEAEILKSYRFYARTDIASAIAGNIAKGFLERDQVPWQIRLAREWGLLDANAGVKLSVEAN